MAKIMEVKIFELRLLIGAIEGLPESILANRLTVACEYEVRPMDAG
jgi:hypothetical protein